jgi:hypothetical protein
MVGNQGPQGEKDEGGTVILLSAAAMTSLI